MKTVLIDIDDTLLDFNVCAKMSILKSAEKFKINFSDVMFERYLEQNLELWAEYEKGKINREDIFKTRFPALFKEFNINSDGIAFENSFQMYFKTECKPVDGAKGFLEYLKNKYELYIVSNSIEETQKSRLKKAGLDIYFKKLFVSDKIGYQKPTKEFFEYCFKNIPNIDKKETIIIGDSLTSDIQGGINAGIKTCWFNPKKLINTKKIPYDYEISCFEDIKKIL